MRDAFSTNHVQLLQYHFLKYIFFFHWGGVDVQVSLLSPLTLVRVEGLTEKGSYSMDSLGPLLNIWWYHPSRGEGLLHFSLLRVKVKAPCLAFVILCVDGAWYFVGLAEVNSYSIKLLSLSVLFPDPFDRESWHVLKLFSCLN